jgi:2-C-methyl-D-erythritol 4-phosphate cytidylyltransferase
MEKYAVIVAGGVGLRMGAALPKQFLELHGKPVLWHTLEAFLAAFNDIQIILVLPQQYFETGQHIISSTTNAHRVWMCAGGETRFHSVKNGLDHIHKHAIIFVHDGVRCLLTPNLIKRCYDGALNNGNAIPAINAVDSMRIEKMDGNEIIDRNKVRIIQTPQTFYSDIIKSAFEQDYHETFTDEASVVEKLGVKINLVEGEETNIKITKPIDLLIADKILEERELFK